jgi:hypothetical protein
MTFNPVINANGLCPETPNQFDPLVYNFVPAALTRTDAKKYPFALEVSRSAYVRYLGQFYGVKRAVAIARHLPKSETVMLRFERKCEAVNMLENWIGYYNRGKEFQARIYNVNKVVNA